MTNSSCRRAVWRVILPTLVVSAVSLGSVREAHAGATGISGTLTTQQVACPTLCTAGPLTGNITGSFSWTMDTMTATGNPDVVILVGTFVITTANGTLTGTDMTLWNFSTGQFTDQSTFTGGTGAYAGASGHANFTGTFLNGQGQSNYHGVLKT